MSWRERHPLLYCWLYFPGHGAISVPTAPLVSPAHPCGGGRADPRFPGELASLVLLILGNGLGHGEDMGS